MIDFKNYIKYKTYIYNILAISCFGLLSLLAISLVNPETSTTYAIENSGNPKNSEDNNSDIALFANNTTPSATLTISNSGDNTVLASPDSGTVYSTHSITMSSVNISNYILSISTPAELKSVSGKTTLSGANGATGNSMSNNTWGYSYDKTGSISDTGSLTYSSFTGSAQNLESGTTPTTTSRNLILAAKFGDDAEAGHYTGTVNLLLTATPKSLINYSITYNANGGSNVPSAWSTADYDSSFTTSISSAEPTRDGYKFLGWSTNASAIVADSTYAPGASITLTSSSPSLTLYAVWEKTVFNGITTMQEMTAAICDAAEVGDNTALIDTRDKSTYTIAKLTDKRCWMAQNLRLAGGSTLSPNDSNISTTFVLPASTSSFSGTDPAAGQMKNASDPVLGAYYSYNAATAGTMASVQTGVANYDICPLGWKLPDGELSELLSIYPKSANYSFHTDGGRNGFWFGASSIDAGGVFFPAAGHTNGNLNVEGCYRRNGLRGNGTSAIMDFYYDVINAGATNSRSIGYSVRCVAK